MPTSLSLRNFSEIRSIAFSSEPPIVHKLEEELRILRSQNDELTSRLKHLEFQMDSVNTVLIFLTVLYLDFSRKFLVLLVN